MALARSIINVLNFWWLQISRDIDISVASHYLRGYETHNTILCDHDTRVSAIIEMGDIAGYMNWRTRGPRDPIQAIC